MKGGWRLLQYHGGDNSTKINRDDTYGFLIILRINALCIKLASSLRYSIHCRCLHGLLSLCLYSLFLCMKFLKALHAKGKPYYYKLLKTSVLSEFFTC